MFNKSPIRIYTPAIPAIGPGARRQKKQDTASGGASAGTGTAQTQIPSLETLFQQMLTRYLPETVEFTPLSEEVLSETIRNWIRPAYEQAIQNRREQTQRINAELDADAWSRGMGQSTYLTDVKERQLRGESRDVDTLESDYASTLAGQLYDAIKEQQKMKIEVDQFNAEQTNRAREKAMSAAQALYGSYRSRASAARSGSAETDDGDETEVAFNGDALPKTDYQTAANTVARMSPAERARLYNDRDVKYLALRNELIYSLGSGGFASLMRAFPGA